MFRITLKGLLGHKLRFLLTTFAITFGVACVVAAFVFTGSVRAQFNTLFEDINAGIDLQVRGREQFDSGTFGGNAGAPVPEELLGEIAAVDGVADAAGTVGGTALPIDANGDPVEKQGGFPLGLNWSDAPDLATITITDGRPPEADDEIVMDIDTAELGEFSVGDTVQVIAGSQPPAPYQLVGLVTFGESNALAGATLTGFTTAEAQRVFNLEGVYQTIEVAVEEGADTAAVTAEIAELLPDEFEVVDQETVIDEGQESVGTFIDIFLYALLGFAGVILFVSIFLIYNTFRILVGQRVRELALLRAVGASRGQVFRSVLGEALVIGLISALLGLIGGILFGLALLALLNSTDFGTGNTAMVLDQWPFIAAFGVGVLVTLVSSLLPAWQSTRVPPVAAMREGFSLDGGSMWVRLIVGGLATLLGLLMVGGALSGDADGSAILFGMVIGSILIFLGVSALSPLIAAPVARLLGAPFRVFRITGRLASENAARSPRRTASTASALMVGLALVTMALVVGTSIKSSFVEQLDNGVSADWYISSGFIGFSPTVAEELSTRPELSAVNAGRQGMMQVDGSTKFFTALDFATLEDMFELDVVEGEVPPDGRGVLVDADPAADLGLHPGDMVTVVFNETGAVELPVLAVFENDSIVGTWVLDLETQRENFTEDLDIFVTATTADGVSEDEARAAIGQVIAPYPQLEVQDAEEFASAQEAQLDTVLIVVNMLLLFAVFIAFIGITNTLALSVFERTRELGLLRAIGETKKQVWGMITLEAMIVALFGAALGVIIGLGFGYATSSALPDSFITTIEVPVTSIIVIFILAAILGVVAALYPAYRATRLNVLDAVATE